MAEYKNALISVYDKTGIEELAAFLSQNGVRLISSGGTKKYLEQKGFSVTAVEEITEFPEMLEGRVKTMHPKILGGILAKRIPDHALQLQQQKIEYIDFVIVNLYPFEDTVADPECSMEQAVEQIDIGGPSLLRAAAKNFKYTTVIYKPEQYNGFIRELKGNGIQTTEKFRLQCVVKVFRHTARYNTLIAEYLGKLSGETAQIPDELVVQGKKVQDLRYGENPHQAAGFYKSGRQNPLGNFKQLHGKELSFNNILDLNAAYNIINEFEKNFCVILKHNNPCGAAEGLRPAELFKEALSADPVSAFGGIIGFNCRVDKNAAEEIAKIFTECILAPDYDEQALQVLQKKKNVRILCYQKPPAGMDSIEIKTVSGGWLLQQQDQGIVKRDDCRVVSHRQPSESEWQAMLFGWKIVKHVKSNAVVFVNINKVVGVGAGQMSRVDSTELAVRKAANAQQDLSNSVVASDAFFPFRDGIEALAQAGATAVIQPGGSIRDEEVIEAANQNNLAMVFTGIRHFKH